jgi:protein-tyrosine phosphatase
VRNGFLHVGIVLVRIQIVFHNQLKPLFSYKGFKERWQHNSQRPIRMTAAIIDLKNAEDKRDVVHRAVELLADGKIVAIPTETVYGLAVNALHPDAVERLLELKGRPENKPLTLAIKSLDDALDYVPNMSTMARRVARRSWPGPVTLVMDATHQDSVIHRLAPSVQQAMIPNGTIGLRNPAHEATLQIMRLCAGPILLTSANLSGQPDAVEGSQVIEQFGDSIDMIVDDGSSQYGKPSSVVQILENRLSVLREGVVDADTVKKLTNFIALIVCTGNTCRSPMGEGLMKKRIAEKIKCAVDELEDRGISVFSAGIAAMPGSPATGQAVEVMEKIGIDITGHSSQPITGRLAQYADVILTLTNGHRQALISHWPLLEPRTKTLRRDGADVSDPIGSPVEVYSSCANQIDENLAAWVEEFDLSQFM